MKYGKRASYYDMGRPGYSELALKYIFKDYNDSVIVADIGAGTGKLTFDIAPFSKTIYAVEPDLYMRQIAEKKSKKVGNVYVKKGSAEDTSLPNESVDVICVAQAFHWFDEECFKKECLRILKPNGRVFIIHNTFPNEIKDLLPLPKNDDSNHNIIMNKRKEKRKEFFGKDCIEAVFDNKAFYDKEMFVNYYLSFSTTPNIKDEGRHIEQDEIINEICKAFEQRSKNGLLEIPFQTEVYTSLTPFKMGENL